MKKWLALALFLALSLSLLAGCGGSSNDGSSSNNSNSTGNSVSSSSSGAGKPGSTHNPANNPPRVVEVPSRPVDLSDDSIYFVVIDGAKYSHPTMGRTWEFLRDVPGGVITGIQINTEFGYRG